jgi:hypothetical protein
MKKFIKRLKKQVSAVLVTVMIMSVFVPLQVVVEASQEPWRDAYANVLRNRQPRFSDDVVRGFFLYDLDGDGIPELFLLYDWGQGGYIFTYRQGQVVQLSGYNFYGNAYLDVSIPNHPDIRGLFVRDDSRTGLWTNFLTMQNGEVVSTEVHNAYFDYSDWDENTSYSTSSETFGIIENNRVVRTYTSRTSYRNDTILNEQTDPGFNEARDAALARLAGTPVTYHDINEGNIAIHILGITANANSHPFAIELQNIINNPPAGHTLEFATLINLDERGEQQGILVRTISLDRTWSSYHMQMIHEYEQMLIFMVGNDVRRHTMSYTYGFGPTVFLLENNMLLSADGFGGRSEYSILRLQNGELQSRYLSQGYGSFYYGSWDSVYSENRERATEISENRFDELAREFGLVGFWRENMARVQDQTAQILAMQAPNPINVTIGNTPVNFTDQPPIIVDGRTLVPVRGVFEALGFGVSWNEQARQVTLSRPNDTIIITIDSATFTTNNTNRTLDVPAQIIGGRTMVPIRAVLESVGYTVGWEEATRTVVITTN